MKRSPRLTQGFTRTLSPTLERFIRVNRYGRLIKKKKASLGPQNGKWLKRASFIARSPRSSRRHAVAPRWGRRPQRHTGGGGPAPKAAIGSRHRPPPPKHLDIFKGIPLGLPRPLSDQFTVRVVCSCPLCIYTLCVERKSIERERCAVWE